MRALGLLKKVYDIAKNHPNMDVEAIADRVLDSLEGTSSYPVDKELDKFWRYLFSGTKTYTDPLSGKMFFYADYKM